MSIQNEKPTNQQFENNPGGGVFLEFWYPFAPKSAGGYIRICYCFAYSTLLYYYIIKGLHYCTIKDP